MRERRGVFLEPLERGSGCEPDALVQELQRILFPADVLIIMSEAKLKKALDRVLGLKEEKLGSMRGL